MTLTELPPRIWQELERAVADRQHSWRTPVLASVDSEGLPQARTLVLRGVDEASQTLQFFTDSRSPKALQIQHSAQIQLVFWSPALKWQLRVTAMARVETSGSEVDAAWQRVMQSPARQDYLSPLAPGEVLPDGKRDGLGEAHHLAIVNACVNHLDWLSLSPAGHQRAEISKDILRWLTP